MTLLALQHAVGQGRGDLDSELDRFAAAQLNALQAPSFRNNVEYCGLVGVDGAGRLVATKAAKGTADGCQPPDDPQDLDVFASYHTHAGYSDEHDNEVPSVADMQGDLEEGINGYVATPGGRLWLIRADSGIAYQLCGVRCLKADPNFRECAGYPPGAEYSLGKLEARVRNDRPCDVPDIDGDRLR